ncbi:AbrB/MazE/SpoVT family DNA-binding domain-containing protein [Patescibacteria group bacterium]
MKKYTHKLTKTSKRSYYLVVPREIVDKYKWKEKQKMVIEDKGRGKIEIRDWRRK